MAGRVGRCPTCYGPVPALKTCASETCDVEFYRSEGGRADAIYHSRACAKAQAQRAFRRRAKAA